ncbi:unnamed protein product [Mycena citricolor]|uniref:Protein kinase domain-containing protein n=1 Tax=Mycena citricolor TaxID=2018698 RepID=A0AAD2GTK8_9AGAR|nr:unnamed protein product [Mycena citricolor]CAK5278231.1 unnamed protein product [Mycena citricolor]
MSQSEYIHEDEQYWFDRREFLEKAGYALRPKFTPGYVRPPDVSTRSLKARHSRPSIMDATRTVDSAPILLKYICRTSHPYESSIGQFFSEPQRASDPRNHCIPILDVLPDPEEKDREILVMPRFTGLYAPPFDTVGEVLDCFRQLFEGLAYMHENGVAHRDCALLNVVVDPSKLYPQGNHPVRFKMNPAYTAFSRPTTRTRCWPRYYLIDFGLSRQYSIDGSSPPREEIIRGADKSPPEHDLSRLLKPCNPFPTDVYYLGNMLKENFIEYTVQRKAGRLGCYPDQEFD